MGAEARALGHGGIRVVALAAGVREATVSLGVSELDSGAAPLGRARRPGGGRRRLADLDPGLRSALLALVEPDERGDPMSPLRWTTKSLRTFAAELTRQGHRAGADTVAGLLHEEGFSLQGNPKALEGKQSPDRDAQFHYLNEQVRDYRDAGEPVVSVDTKKKELVGNYRNGGREWRLAGDPVRVRDHDFPDLELGKAIPYGTCDLAANIGWVNVGTDHDTAQFAVESIRRWRDDAGRAAYPRGQRLLITANSGGSNSTRTRAWKTELAALALETGWRSPRATSRPAPPIGTRSSTGSSPTSPELAGPAPDQPRAHRAGHRLHHRPHRVTRPRRTGHRDILPIRRHDWHGEWNYTPVSGAATPARAPVPRPGRGDRPGWAHRP
jgi:hypothetical protein